MNLNSIQSFTEHEFKNILKVFLNLPVFYKLLLSFCNCLIWESQNKWPISKIPRQKREWKTRACFLSPSLSFFTFSCPLFSLFLYFKIKQAVIPAMEPGQHHIPFATEIFQSHCQLVTVFQLCAVPKPGPHLTHWTHWKSSVREEGTQQFSQGWALQPSENHFKVCASQMHPPFPRFWVQFRRLVGEVVSERLR